MPTQAYWRHDLPSGTLHLTLAPGGPDPARFFTLGLRQNPRRGFLFVSRVLGKHLPARPGDMQRTYGALADRLPGDVTLFIGMAETATALGRGVFEAYCTRQGAAGRLYVTSTRYRVHGETLTFEEVHSHATTQWLHLPVDGEKRDVFLSARHVVIVDDETSTGATAVNLARAISRLLPHLERVTVASLQDFAPEEAYAHAPVPFGRRALLSGTVRFDASPAWQPHLPEVTGGGGHTAPGGGERLGVWCGEGLARPVPDVPPGARVLVLGTGEHMSPAHPLALALERRGARTFVKATTRSPILPFGELTERAEFPDNYGEGIPNYLYRSRGEHYDAAVVLTENGTVPAGLADVLRAWYGVTPACG